MLAQFCVFSVVWYALLLVALHQQWFSRLKRGFLLTLLVSLITIGVGGTALMAVWNYSAATQVLTAQTEDQLQNIGRMLELQIEQAVAEAFDHMNDAAKVLYPHMAGAGNSGPNQLLTVISDSSPLLWDADLYAPNGLPLTRNAPPSSEPVKLAVAFALEGKPFRWGPYRSATLRKSVVLLAVPVRSPQGAIAGALVLRFDLGKSMERLFAGVRFGASGTALVATRQGQVLAHSDQKRTLDDVSSYPAVQRALAGQSGVMRGRNKAGENRLFFYQPIRNRNSIEPENLALLTEMDVDEAARPARKLLEEFFLGGAIVLLLSVVLGAQAGGYIRRPLTELAGVVQKIREGDLAARFIRPGRDEVGQLGAALNDMAAGLQERDRIKELFGRYVTTQVSDQVLKGQVNLGGELRRVTILFSDIRDFTALSEQMTPQQVVGFLNHYFSEMVEAVFEYGGVLDKFIGDGMMAVFGSFGGEPDHARRAVMAALRMKALLGKINGERSVEGLPAIRIGIGVHTDDVIVGNIGSAKRLEYTVIGDGVNTASRVEALNKDLGTTVLITGATYEQVKESFECRPMPETRLRGKSTAIRFYEVVSGRTQGV
ncbi:MAG TPA: adenylate/guanylate cyclase domain-containing protein [Bryobacteraceae bacterium]|nr:adenylate/guanylate cyclase domain-containing protein [Bryobacteraceae bacterium]